jgi:hypothetical protein
MEIIKDMFNNVYFSLIFQFIQQKQVPFETGFHIISM